VTEAILTTTSAEENLLNTLRVKKWVDFQGQLQVKTSLSIVIQAAKERNEAIDHVLLYGPPGLGKTTLAHLIAQEMQSNIKISSGTVLSKAGDLAAILSNLEEGDILFIDEVHRLRKPVEEMLYSAMEDYVLDIVIGKATAARTVRIDLPKFTLVGATTQFGSLAGPFRDRFGIVHRMKLYGAEELLHILFRAAETLNITLPNDSALEIARRSRGTPRVALTLLKRVRDFTQVHQIENIDVASVDSALDLLGIDKMGLTDNDRRFLDAIINKFQGGPVGLTTLAATLNEDSVTIEEVIEPYLQQLGFIKKTPQGRVVMDKAISHLRE